MHSNSRGPSEPDIAKHYSRGNLLERLRAAMSADGADPDHPTIATLAPYDHFHGRGLEATEEAANALSLSRTDSILDVGSGIGGPARYFAHRFGCHVTGIDLTGEFCEAARMLTRALGLDDRVRFEQGDALMMPFADASFDGAYSMNVSMNIADKDRFYGEIRRALKPGAWFVLSELARGPGPAPAYPTPWAESETASFLATPAETRQRLEAHGFRILASRETTREALAFGARSRAMVERGEKPPHRAVQLIHADVAPAMAANVRDGMVNRSLIPIEILCKNAG